MSQVFSRTGKLAECSCKAGVDEETRKCASNSTALVESKAVRVRTGRRQFDDFMGESTAGESRHGLDGVLAGG